MTERDQFSKKVLEQNGLSDGALSDADRDNLRAMLHEQRQRDARLRGLMLWSWMASVVLFLAFVFTYLLLGRGMPTTHSTDTFPITRYVGPVLGLLALVLFVLFLIIAAGSTAMYAIRYVSAPGRIEARLDIIEQHLARLEAARTGEGTPRDAEQDTGRPPPHNPQ